MHLVSLISKRSLFVTTLHNIHFIPIILIISNIYNKDDTDIKRKECRRECRNAGRKGGRKGGREEGSKDRKGVRWKRWERLLVKKYIHTCFFISQF